MLIATIETDDYLLKDSKDAEALLRVLQRAKKLDSTYLNSGPHYSESQESVEVKISIVTKELISQEDMKQIRDECLKDSLERRAKKEESQ